MWVHLQELGAVLTVLHVPARKALTPPGNQEAGAVAEVSTLDTDPSVDIGDWVHRKSGHCCPQVGRHTAKDAGLP